MTLTAGFANVGLDSQQAFRAVLEAIAHPGRILTVRGPATPPPPLDTATTAVALTLLDFETPVWLDARAASEETVAYLRFHCGAPLAPAPAAARFAIVAAPERVPDLTAFDVGSDARPDRSATLLVQVRALTAGRGRRLTGPGINGEVRLEVEGLLDGFWQQWRAQGATFPRGVDVLLCAGDRLAALPRTTRAEG